MQPPCRRRWLVVVSPHPRISLNSVKFSLLLLLGTLQSALGAAASFLCARDWFWLFLPHASFILDIA